MKWRKRLIFGLVLLIFAIGLLAFLADRDMTRIYGGLTKQVDSSQFKRVVGSAVIKNVSILSPDGTHFIPNKFVTIENGIIVSIDDTTVDLQQQHIINGRGKYLIPGLTDSHVHLFKSPNDLLLYAANGITQIRELIGEPDHLTWKQEIKDGRLGPEMFVASPRIASFEPMEGLFMAWSQGFLNLNNAEQAMAAVHKLHQQGYDAVKIYSQINQETYFSVTDTAKSLGMKAVGHVPWSVEIKDIYSNQDGVAHLEELMNALNREFGRFKSVNADEFLKFVELRSPEIAAQLLKHDISVTTTLWLVESFVRQKFELEKMLSEVELEYENPGISEWTPRVPQGGLGWLPGVNRYQLHDPQTQSKSAARRRFWETYAQACRVILKDLIEAGVKVMAGTDTNLPPTVPGFSLHDELISLNKAGMSSAQVLRSATLQPAEWLNNNAGKLEVGRKANMVLLDADPLLDISNSQLINSVFLNGRILDRTQLDAILVSVKEANDFSRKQDISRFVN